ncbi:hypothetical protein P8452_61396 [Trifolium repens]|nr:hypothetical protein P8452_61396 [Trifolium repens]
MPASLSISSSTMLLYPKLGATTCAMSLSTTSYSKTHQYYLYSLRQRLFSPWSDRKGRCKVVYASLFGVKVVYASLFGVGAPEALVIGVVALLVFGPKGLAEVAKNLGKTLREFQPTIREIQDVSREFKSTLEREIGIDDISNPLQNTYSSNVRNTTPTPSATEITNNSQTVVDPNGNGDPSRAYSSEDYLKITEEQLKAAAAQQQVQTPPPKEAEIEQEVQSPANETAAIVPPPQKPESESFPSDS